MANRTNVFQALLAGIRNTDNSILAGGTVEFYEPGTTTPKDVYTDPLKGTAVAEVELDANGQAEIWGNGLFDVVIKNAAGVTKYTWESVYLGKDIFVPVSVIADYVAGVEDSIVVVDTGAGDITITLPDPGEMQQAPFIVKSTDDANTVTISRGGTTINGDPNYVLSEQWEGVQLGFDGINFYTLGNFASIATTITTEASASTAGKIELATVAEVVEATDAVRAVTPATVRYAVPAGAVMPFAQNSAPAGWLKCNGQAVSRTTYASLFAAIGATYGAGDGSTTFLVPDLRGEFVRGWDDARGIDATRAIGTTQSDAFQGHYHEHMTGADTTAGGRYTVGGNTNSVKNGCVRAAITDGTNGDPRTAAETRPRNVALLYCIKF